MVEYTHTKDQWGADEELAAVCLTDVFDDGLSMVYSFYDPDGASSSLGIYVILDHVALVKEAGLPFLYLGYWVPGSTKMNYKSLFSALEIYKNGEWQPIGDPNSHVEVLMPNTTSPIAEQVSKIILPEKPKPRF